MVDLAHLRNQAARTVGFDDYYQMSLELHEIDPTFLAETVSQMEDLTNDPFSDMKSKLDNKLSKRFGVDVEAIRPWHYADVFFQEAPNVSEVDIDELFTELNIIDLTAEFFRGIDLSIDDLVEKSDHYERPGKNQHAFCIHIDRKGDVRVLANCEVDCEVDGNNST